MAAKKYNKKNAKKQIAKPRRSLVPKDGTNLLCTSYFEIQKKQPAGGEAGILSYTLKIAPQGLTLLQNGVQVANKDTVGIFSNKADNGILVAAGGTSADVPVSRFNDFAGVYNQYKINGAKVSVIVDRECGLENPICFTASKNSSTPHNDMSTIVAGAHKSYTMTESRRTAKYGWTARESADKEYRMTNAQLSDGDAHFIKIFQETEAKADGLCKHRISVALMLTLKDSSKNA